MIMPSHAKNVKQYQDALPLFARYQVETYLAGMFNPTVQLKSGGYIVIGVTEALVAIDVNSGRATKEGSIEETALKTNLEAADEVARQLRLRDLAGLIVIDFIDMDERKNNSAVEKRMKERLKTDRARIQVGRISGFGLMEMSRQRLRPGMIEATTQPCPHCHGTGLIRSDDNMALSILRQIEEEGTRRRSREVLVKCPVSIANFLMNQKREHIAQIEARYGLSVRIEGDPHLVSPNFALEKFKTATRVVKAVDTPVVSVDTSIMDQVDEDEEAASDVPETSIAEDGEPKPKRRRRRRRSRSRSKSATTEGTETVTDQPEGEANERPDASADDGASQTEAAEAEPEQAEEGQKKKTRTRSSRSRSSSKAKADAAEIEAKPTETSADAEQVKNGAEVAVEDTAPKKAKRAPRSRSTKSKTSKAEDAQSVAAAATVEDVSVVAADPAPVEDLKVPEPVAEVPEPAPEEPPKPKKRGWWSLGK